MVIAGYYVLSLFNQQTTVVFHPHGFLRCCYCLLSQLILRLCPPEIHERLIRAKVHPVILKSRLFARCVLI